MLQQPMVLMDAAGRRRSPASTPGYLAGRASRNKGMQYPPDPPRAEEIILVMRQAGRDRHGLRIRALIALLWRGGLGIPEALALNETDVDARRGSLLVRHGKGDKRREAGMEAFGFEQVEAWMAHRTMLPAGPLLCVIEGAPAGGAGQPPQRVASCASSLSTPVSGGGSRPTSCATRTRWTWLAREWRSTSSNANSGTPTSGRRRPTCRHRSQRDHRRRPAAPTAHHLGHRRPQAPNHRALGLLAHQLDRPQPPGVLLCQSEIPLRQSTTGCPCGDGAEPMQSHRDGWSWPRFDDTLRLPVVRRGTRGCGAENEAT